MFFENINCYIFRTKRLVVDVIACQQGESLVKILETPATDEQVSAMVLRELQIIGGIEDSSKITFLISQQKHML